MPPLGSAWDFRHRRRSSASIYWLWSTRSYRFQPALHSIWNQHRGGFKDEVRLANDTNGFTLEIIAKERRRRLRKLRRHPNLRRMVIENWRLIGRRNRLRASAGRYTVMIKNQSRHTRPIMDKIIREFSPLQAFARQSFTFDRGTEFAGFRVLEDGIGVRSWFAIPVHPGRKVLLRMQTSAFADSCQAIRILQPSPSKTSLTLPATSTICRENASAPKHQSRCSWRIFAKKAGPLP